MSDPYYRLLFAYPASYRRERGRELVDMYRETAGDGRPRLADAADLIRGGLRERLRRGGLGGLAAAVPAVSVFTLAALAGLSVYYLVVFELRPPAGDGFGPFATVYLGAYVGWLVTAVIAAVRPGRPARTAAAVTLVLLIVAIGLRFAGPWPSLMLFMGLPLAVLGLFTLALPTVASWPARLAPVAVAAATGIAAAVRLPIGSPELVLGDSLWSPGAETYGMCCYYREPSSYVMHLAAIALLIAGVIAALAYARRGSARGAWILLVLATPIAALSTMRLAEFEQFREIGYAVSDWNEIQACVAGLIAMLITAVGLPAAVALVRTVRRIPRPRRG